LVSVRQDYSCRTSSAYFILKLCLVTELGMTHQWIVIGRMLAQLEQLARLALQGQLVLLV
jgi:hypothetical protein